jgi:hypothetical protein
MDELSKLQELHTAGGQSAGYDYQFYYFVYLALDLEPGQKIGFEVKEDIHIEKEDGTTVLFQVKHTIYENQNLTTLDSDLWKTLSYWVDFIKATEDKNYLKKHSFILVTNKNDGNNEFLDTLSSFKVNQNIDAVISKLKELKDKTKDETIKKYINNIISLGKKKIKQFIPQLSIKTSIDDIVKQIKDKILDQIRGEERLVQPIFEKLLSNIQETKYLDIKDKNMFEISRDEFDKKFRRCFYDAYKDKPLPKRNMPVLLPENLEDQTFIKQLLDIGDVQSGSTDIQKYTTLMLKAFNDFSYWVEENFILYDEMNSFLASSILIWRNRFRKQYRQIEKKITNGTLISELEDEIKNLGVQLVDFIREQDLTIQGFPTLDREFSNGHFYALSDDLKIGWHYDWENKYKKK